MGQGRAHSRLLAQPALFVSLPLTPNPASRCYIDRPRLYRACGSRVEGAFASGWPVVPAPLFMNDHARYGSLRDYFRVLRAQKWLILFIVVLGAGVGLGISLYQDKKYESTASMSFQDVSQDVGLLGTSIAPRDAPAVVAAQSASTLTRSDVVERVRKSLNTTLTPNELRDKLTSTVDPGSNLVVLIVKDTDPQVAADIANAFAHESQRVFNETARDRFTNAARALRRRIKRLGKGIDPTEKLLFQSQLARLEPLSTFANAATIAEFARPGEDPVSPKPVRNTIFGVLAGLGLGLLFAFLRDALDRRLRTAADVRRELNLPIVGYVGATVFGRKLFNQKTGVRSIADIDLEAFRIMRRNLEFLDVDRPVKVLAVSSPLPQEGKTTVAASLAIAAAASGRRVLLLEADLRHPTLPGRLGAKAEPGLSDYLIGDAEPADVLQLIEFTDPNHSGNGHGPTGPKIAYVSAGSPTPDPAELLGSQRFDQLIDTVRDAYDLVIIDTAPVLPVVDTLEFIPKLDGVVLCVRIGQTTRDQAVGARAALERFPERPVGVVVTGTLASDDSSYGSYGSTYAYKPRVGAGA